MNCKTLDEKIKYITQNEYNYFLNKSNVVGVGLGYKIKNGFNTFQKCLSVFVSNKISYFQFLNNKMLMVFPLRNTQNFQHP